MTNCELGQKRHPDDLILRQKNCSKRNGRIDRHGQKASEVSIYHFVGKGYEQQAIAGVRAGDLEGDLEFLMRAAIKVNNIREDLGKVGPVIAQQVEEAMLGYRVTLDTTAAEQESEPVRRLLKFERKVRDQIEKLREQLSETRRNLRLTPDNIESVVRIGLELAQQPQLIPTIVGAGSSVGAGSCVGAGLPISGQRTGRFW